jgi:PEP-CTERM motif-containing protein
METIAFGVRVGHRRVSHLCAGRHLVIICAAIALAVACVPGIQAQTFGPSVSLTTLTNDDGTVLVGDKLFSNFFVVGDPAASNITVTALISDGNFGLEFGGGFVANNSSMDFSIGYMVNVTNSANLISGANLTFNGASVPPNSGPALAEVVEQVLTNMDINVPYGQMTVYVTPTAQQLSTNMAINPPQSYLNLQKDVLVDSFTLTAFASISTIDQSYMQIPEPSTIALAAMGAFTGLLVLRRRRR